MGYASKQDIDCSSSISIRTNYFIIWRNYRPVS